MIALNLSLSIISIVPLDSLSIPLRFKVFSASWTLLPWHLPTLFCNLFMGILNYIGFCFYRFVVKKKPPTSCQSS